MREALTDTLICPAGQVLNRQSDRGDGACRYKAKGSVCRGCEQFGVCTTSKCGRAVMISVYEDQVLANRQRVRSEEFRPLMQIRRQRGEAPFGYFKMFGGLRRFAGRGLAYATKKTLIAAIGWNLLLLVKAVMRSGGLNSPVSLLIRLLSAAWTVISMLLTRIGTSWQTAPPSRAQFLYTPPEPGLSGGC